MCAHVREPQRLRLVDQHPEDPAATREIPDRAMRLLVDALGDELLEQLSPLVEHADRRIPRAGEFLRYLQQAVEDHIRVQLGEQRAPDVEQAAEPRFVHAPTIPPAVLASKR
jgi:hypothetical protein